MHPVLVTLSGASNDKIPYAIADSFRSSVSQLRAMGWSKDEIKDLIHSMYRKAIAERAPGPLLGSATVAAVVTAVSGALAAAAGGVAAVVGMVRAGKATKDAAKRQAQADAEAAEAAKRNADLAKKAILVAAGVAGVIVISKMASKGAAR